MSLKPKYRGRMHQAMIFVSLIACWFLLAQTSSERQLQAASIYSVFLVLLFIVSTLYHRVYWSEVNRFRMKRIDHLTIYMFMAGSATPVALLGLSEEAGNKFFVLFWSFAFLGSFLAVLFPRAPKYVTSILYLSGGFILAPFLPELYTRLTRPEWLMLTIGASCYIIGAIGYALKRPHLNPKIFGYHEAFHFIVTIAAFLHFCMIYSLVLNSTI